MDFGSMDRIADAYAAVLKSQSLEGFSALCHPEVSMSGLQTAEGRLAVLRQVHKLFGWYQREEVCTVVVQGKTTETEASISLSHRGVELVDVIRVLPETGEIVHIARCRADVRGACADQPPPAAALRTMSQGWHEYSALLRGAHTVTAPTLCTPRRAHFLNRGVPPPLPPGTPAAASTKALRRSGGGSEGKAAAATPLVPRPPAAATPTVGGRPESLAKPMLDYSFLEIASLKQLISTEPRTGTRLRLRPVVERKVEEPKKEVVVEKPPVLDDGEETLVMVKAKATDGRELAYQWDKNEKYEDVSWREELLPSLGIPVAGQTQKNHTDIAKYVTSSVRLSSNQLTDCSLLTRALKLIVHHSVLHLTFVDLSSNGIHTLPQDLAELPLQVLYLHSNNIASYEQVARLSTIPTLHSLTLWNNPIENASAGTYKTRVVFLLSSAFRGKTLLRKLDHVTLSRQDVQNCRMYEAFHVTASQNNRRRAQGIM
eukprot:Rhum_TRINITY_DN2768_c0_g2::Rhum_TRINITY_DN2768_c0_g2_i1::g.8223::m.8223